MKTLYKLLILSLVLLSTTCNYAQIDTTVYFPIKVGNFWQLKAQPPNIGHIMHYIEKDTLINEMLYYKLKMMSTDWTGYNKIFIRPEGKNNERIFIYMPNCYPNLDEPVLYDFTVPDSTIWISCYPFTMTSSIYTHQYSIPFLNKDFTTSTFVDAWIDSSITPPETTYYMIYYEKISKGIGFVEWFGEQAPLYVIEGMVIDGVHYGNTSLFVGVDDDEDQVITDFILHQNYPNPFNPVTKIKYEIPDQVRNDNVKIKVYDVLGNEVATLVDEYKPAGSYEVEFNAEKLSSGIYFYRLQADNLVETKKMILLR